MTGSAPSMLLMPPSTMTWPRQAVFYGSDGTRTRDRRRDRPVQSKRLQPATTPNHRLQRALFESRTGRGRLALGTACVEDVGRRGATYGNSPAAGFVSCRSLHPSLPRSRAVAERPSSSSPASPSTRRAASGRRARTPRAGKRPKVTIVTRPRVEAVHLITIFPSVRAWQTQCSPAAAPSSSADLRSRLSPAPMSDRCVIAWGNVPSDGGGVRSEK
jgi:hypothetical protein